MKIHKWAALPAALAIAGGVAACGEDGGGTEGSGGGEELSGQIRIDGSSTVAPLTEAVAGRFQEEHPGVQVSVGTSGTGGGFEQFCAGETQISDASRQIDSSEEQACQQSGVEFEEIAVANDALSVVVNPENPITCMSPDQLSQIYGPNADTTSWTEIEGLKEDYDEQLDIFSPGADSGTFDYFTEAINGEEGAQRSQGVNVVGENDNATVTGVAGSPGGIGYLGYSFFSENEEQLKALEIENDQGECVPPTEEAAQDGSYNPLGRQLYIYPSGEALQDPAVQEFVQFYLDNVNEVIPEVGYIPLTDEQLNEARDKVDTLLGSGGGSGGGGESGGSGEGGSGGETTE